MKKPNKKSGPGLSQATVELANEYSDKDAAKLLQLSKDLELNALQGEKILKEMRKEFDKLTKKNPKKKKGPK